MIKNLKKLRTEKGISQQYLAGVLGISQQSINKYENHNVEPDISLLITIAEYFNTTIDYLVGKSEGNDSLFNFNSQEEQLITQYRQLNDTEKQCINTIVATFCNAKKSN